MVLIRKSIVIGLIAAASITIASAGAALAHHGFGKDYDASAPIILKGTVDSFLIRNPHAVLYIKATDQSGATMGWEVGLGGAGAGYVIRDTKGMSVTIEAYHAHDRKCEVRAPLNIKTCKAGGRTITFANGCKRFIGQANVTIPDKDAPADGAENLPTTCTAKQM